MDDPEEVHSICWSRLGVIFKDKTWILEMSLKRIQNKFFKYLARRV